MTNHSPTCVAVVNGSPTVSEIVEPTKLAAAKALCRSWPVGRLHHSSNSNPGGANAGGTHGEGSSLITGSGSH